MTDETITIPNTNIETPTPPEFSTLIPEGYGEKEWVKNAGDLKTVFKMVEDQREAISKRPAGIPQDDATAEERTTFNKAFGVPETLEGYEFEKIEGKESNEDFDKGIKALFHKSDVSIRQAKALEKGFNELVAELSEKAKGDSEQQDIDFDKLAKETFGDREEDVMKVTKSLIAQYTPESMKGKIESLNNDALIIMAGVLDKIQKEFIAEDSIPRGNETQVGGANEAQQQAQGAALMISEAYTNWQHPEHDATVEKVQRLFGTWPGK